MGLEERSSPNATYLEIDTCLRSYPVILGVKMWSCILPAGEDWSRVRDRPNPFVWEEDFRTLPSLELLRKGPGGEFGLPQLNYRERKAV